MVTVIQRAINKVYLYVVLLLVIMHKSNQYNE